MENNKTRVLQVMLTAMLAASIVFGGWMVIKNKSARIETAKERSVLLAEKDMLTREAKSLSGERLKFANLSTERKKKIDELLVNLDAKNSEIQKLSRENANLKLLRKKVSEFEQIKNELNNEIAILRSNLHGVNENRSEMASELDHLRMENEKLSSEILFLKTLNTNDFLVQGIKRNNKITAFAGRSKEISLSFDFPDEFIKDLKVSVQTPGGKSYLSTNNNFLSIKATDKPITAVYPSGLNAKRMEMIFKPGSKFEKGIYRLPFSMRKKLLKQSCYT
jgi:hypothetical protein